MEGSSPIVPVLLPSGAIHFAKANVSDTGQDVIQVLLATEGVKSDILGDLEQSSGDAVDWEWALQHVRKNERGRVWQDEELNQLDDGILSNDTAVQQLLPRSPEAQPQIQRHFSAFPLTSHLHTPTIRLVSQHPSLSFHIAFERVPEIADGFMIQWFISRSSTVADVISGIGADLGLTLYLAGPGGGSVDYAIEIYSVNPELEAPERLDPSANVSTTLERLGPQRRLRLVVPEEWYRRPKSRSFSSHISLEDDTFKAPPSNAPAPSDNIEIDNEENGDGTAKANPRPTSTPSSPIIAKSPRMSDIFASPPGTPSPSRRGTFSSNRLSSMFDSWLSLSSAAAAELPSQPNASTATASERYSVSLPMPMDPTQARNEQEQEAQAESDELRVEFEKLMDEFGIKSEQQRQKMREMTPDRKRYLLTQNKQRMSGVSASPSSNAGTAATFGPASASSLIPKLLPQFSGGAMGKFSVGRFGSWTAASASAAAKAAGETTPVSTPPKQRTSGLAPHAESEESTSPSTPPPTNSLWASWWGGPGPVTAEGERSKGDNGKSAIAELTRVGQASSPPSEGRSTVDPYVAGIVGGKANSTTLVKHLVSLRIHAATAKLDWIQDFVGRSKGMEAISTLITSLVGKREKRWHLTQSESLVLLECVKCLRVVVNTDLGLAKIITMPALIYHVVTSLDTGNLKVRSNVADLLAGISVVSEDQGHKLVLDAFSDFAASNGEEFRFEKLIAGLRVPDAAGEALGEDFWAERMPILVLLIAITASCPDLEQRIALRDELSRRGFNEIVVTLRYLGPPASVVERLDGYSEDKLDDEEDFRVRTRKQFEQSERDRQSWGQSESALVYEKLASLAEEYDGLPDIILGIIRSHIRILEREIPLGIKSQILTVASRFMSQLAAVEDLREWIPLLRRFVQSVHDLTGFDPNITDEEIGLVDSKLKALREQLDAARTENLSLSEKADSLRGELDTLKSAQSNSTPNSVGRNGQENVHGIVQRLVQKEKLAVRLQAEVDRLNNENAKLIGASEAQERLKRERDRAKWSAMTEEMSNNKAKIVELESSLRDKDKNIVYLKRAMEALCSRFESSVPAKPAVTKVSDSDFDAEAMSKHAIEAIATKDNEILELRQEISTLQQKLTEAQAAKAERDFKSRVAPPPPPPPPRRQSQPFGSPGSAVPSTPPPPPPPPPPPAPAPVMASDQLAIAVPPPPPPPPPALAASPTAPAPAAPGSAPPPPPPPPPTFAPSPTSPAPPPPPPPPMSPPPPPPPPAQSPGSSTSGNGPPPPPPPPAPNGAPAWKLARRATAPTGPPPKKLKPFFWEKSTATQNANSVWGQLGFTGAQVQLDDLEDVFSLDKVSSKPVTASQVVKSKKQVTTLLDITRANNVAIMLKTLKLSPAAICEAILSVDDSRLSAEDLVSISKQLPTAEEATRIQDFGDTSKLAEADQYFSQILSIPRLQERIACMIYRRRLELEIIEAQPDLSMLHDAAVELCTSDKLRRLLQAVLSIGNALNKSTFRGGASGFRLKSLLKLKETKTAKPDSDCPTLLHYLARVLIRTDPSIILFIQELPHVESAARISVPTVMTAVSNIETGLSKATSEIIACRKAAASPSDKFGVVMQPFIRSSAEGVYALKSLADSAQTKLADMIVYFGEVTEGPEATKPEDVFELMLSFSSSLQKTALEVNATMAPPPPSPSPSVPRVTVEEDEAAATTPKQEKQEFLPASELSVQGSISSINLSVGRGDLDQAIRSLRTGRRRPRQERPLSKMFLDGGQNNRRSRLFE